MKDKRSELSMLQAYRLYTGESPLKSVLVYNFLMIICYGGLSYLTRLMDFFSDELSSDSAIEEAFMSLSQRDGSHPFSWMNGIVVGVGLMLITQRFDRSNPGGKFFRTVKGGFETFKKYRIIVHLTFLVSISVCAIAMFLLDHFEIIGMEGGIVTSIALVTSVVFSMVTLCFTSRIKKVVLSGAIGILTFMIFTFLLWGITIIRSDTVLPYVLLLAIGLILLPISMRSYFSFYKRVYWD